ncbi:hypothetical protein LAZ67_1004237 [Cordylochernes scorpioides]|uniref:Transposase n=1 Tax=Cordylochernes scorpioides TaxID=51811 RepID=A0ABY6JXB7_9ARAC|nr:hypothetical protein LAZ67_1004237 [Cordylochernes scorpioides]
MEDQRICIKFCVKKRIQGCRNFLDVANSLRGCRHEPKTSFRVVQALQGGSGRDRADNERSGRPSTSTTPKKVNKVLELNARKETASLNLEAKTDDPELLKRVITGDETWIYGFDSETTQQASEWRFKNEPRPKKARKAPSKVKVMLTVFFDYQGIVHHEFQQQGSTITADSYLGVLRRLREAIRQKRPELGRSKSWILHHDNAPAHTALKISKFLQDHSTSVFPQPPYSPDLPPCDFLLFGNLKKICGKRKRRPWLGDLPIFKNHAPQQREQRLFEVKPFCPCFDFVSHRNGGSTNLHQVLCEKRIQGCRNFLDVANSLRGCRHEPKTSFRVVQALQGGSGRDRADNERSGRPSTSTTPKKVNKVLELNARKETASLNLEAKTDDPELLKRVITGDETWIYGFDSETTQQASEWRFKNEPRPKKARKAPSKVKVMLTVFFDYQGIVHHEFQQQGSTITADSYLGVLRRLREAIRQKRPELGRSKSWILHHDNAPAHTALKISKFLQDHSTSVFPQPPYSPDLPPCDFLLFGNLKKICGKRKRRPWLGDLPIFKNHAPQQREQRLFEVKPFCPCFDFVSHRNGGSTNLHQVLCEKRIQGCRNFLDVANSLRGCRHEPKTSFRVVQALQGGSGRDRADNERSGRPSTSTTPKKVNKVLELNARKETASLNLEAKTDDPELLKRVITGDETWIYGFDSETTQQASEWRFKNEPRPKKARKAPSKVKVMLTVFFDYQGIVHHEFQQQGSTITADSYLGVLRRLREAIRQKRPELGRSKSWILHHDNAPAHTALKISKFLQDHSTSVFPQPPYSPDLPPCDFLLFGNLKKICGKRKRRPWLGDLPIFKNHAPQQREQRLFEVKPFCPCFDFVSHRNGGSTNLHQVLCEKRIQGCRNFLDVANSLRGCRHEPKTSFRVVQALQGGSGRDRADNERSGRPSTSTTPKKVNKVLELNARKETASLNLEAKTDDPELLKRVITGDETWIYGFDSETTQQASEWRFKNEPRPKKARKAPSKVKVMLTVFFDYQGIVHHEFQQQGSTITADSYLGVLRRLREAIRQKRPELGRSKSWILHHDNAPAHTALKISKFLQDHSTSVFPQPPYSPDLPPCDFLLFGNLKKICGKRKRRPWLGDLPIFKNHAPQQREQRLFEVKPFCPCFDFVSHRNGGSTNLHQVLCEKRIQGCRNFLDVANSLRGCRHEPKTSFRVVQALQGGSGRDRADNERSGRPSTSTTPKKVNKVLELVREDRRITVREVAEEAGISFRSTQSIMKDILGVRSEKTQCRSRSHRFDF